MNNRWTITLEEDPETKELILPFTEEILNTVGWKAGDTIVWKNNNDGTWSLTKQVDKPTKESV
jgi:hypothetical protein